MNGHSHVARTISQGEKISNPHHPKEGPVKRGYFYYLGLGLPTPVFILFEVLILWAIYHAAVTRSIDDYLLYGGIYGIPASLFLGKLWLTEWRKSSRLSIWMKLFLLSNLVPGTFVFGALYYSLGASAYDLVKWFIHLWNNSYVGPYLAGTAVLLVGIGLFWFRTRCRGVYGLTEVIVGIFVASYKYVEASAGSHPIDASDPNLLLALLTAGVYLVVRGLDNIQQGLTSTPGDPVLNPLVTWYKTLGEVVIKNKEFNSAENKEGEEHTG